MTKMLLARVPPHTYARLVRHCAEQTVRTGRRVTIRAVVVEAVEDLLERARRNPRSR